MTRIKICGLMNEEDVKLCVEAGVHTVGFVVNFPEPVPWNLNVAQARELINKVPPFVSSCVVTGGSVDSILYIARTIRPDIIQLHYQETLEEVRAIAEHLSLLGIKTVKALRINSERQCAFEITDPGAAASALSESKLSALLVDSYTDIRAGGTGLVVDLATFKHVQKQTALPVILAGGLSPSNVRQIIRDANPYAIDVLTGVEERPGRKDLEKVFSLVRSASIGLL